MLPKRTLDELALRYKIGRVAGTEIFVEGIQDKIILDYYFRLRKISAAIYTSDTVDVPGQILVARGLELPSARSSVIATRAELDSRGVDLSAQIFLVDRDIEDLVPTPDIGGIVLTDRGCLLAHLITESSLSKFVRIVGRDLISVEMFEFSIRSICSEIYLLRVVVKRMRLAVRILSPNGFVRGTSHAGFTLQTGDYLRACLGSSGLVASEAEVLARMVECRREIDGLNIDPKVMINDHDLWVIMRAIFRSLSDPVNRSADDIRDLFMMTMDESVFDETELFRRIAGISAT